MRRLGATRVRTEPGEGPAPAYSHWSWESQASDEIGPFNPYPRLDQAVPLQCAISVAGTPPARLNGPPTYTPPLPSKAMALIMPFTPLEVKAPRPALVPAHLGRLDLRFSQPAAEPQALRRQALLEVGWQVQA